MNYNGENCPYCGVTFAEGDDVVVCPECATPHHRVCWFAHGECANTHRHGTDFIWKKTAEPEPEAKPEKRGEKSRESANLDIVCPDCGTTSPNGTVRCPECGALLIPFANPTGEPPLAQFRPEFNPHEDIRGVKSGDVALFCRSAGASYIKKFRKKVSWNWAALLFTPFWFFYRKLYKAGSVFLTAYLVINLLMIPAQMYFINTFNESSALVTLNGVTAEINELIEPYIVEEEAAGGLLGSFMQRMYGNTVTISEEGQQAVAEYFEKNYEMIYNNMVVPMQKPLLAMAGIQLLSIILRIVSALLADRLYFKKAATEILRARRATSDERGVQLALFRKGGTNIFLGAGLYFACNMLLEMAIIFITG